MKKGGAKLSFGSNFQKNQEKGRRRGRGRTGNSVPVKSSHAEEKREEKFRD